MLVAIGVISLLVILFFSLSRRFSVHLQTLTLLDQNRIIRNLLESHAGDVFYQLKVQMNSRKGPFFDRAQEWLAPGAVGPAGSFNASQLGYKFNPVLSEMSREYATILDIELDPEPRIEFRSWQSMPVPRLFTVAAGKEWPEKTGEIAVICRARLGDRKMKLTISHQFKFVMLTLPVFKDFGFFFDRLSEEQRQEFSGELRDDVNVMPLEFGEQQDQKIFPLTLGSFPEKYGGSGVNLDRNLSGRLFFGLEDKPILLNLGGEIELRNGKGRFSDLWLVRRNNFAVEQSSSGAVGETQGSIEGRALALQRISILEDSNDPNSRNRTLRGVEVPAIDPDTGKPDPMIGATMFILGFGEELNESFSNGLFNKSYWKLQHFLESDPGLPFLTRGTSELKLASAIKPYGLTMDYSLLGLLSSDPSLAQGGLQKLLNMGGTLIPNREIFGSVMRRYIILSYFGIASIDGILRHYPESGYKPPYLMQPGFADKWYFNPPGTGGYTNYANYQKYMSRVVSGDLAKLTSYHSTSNAFPDGFEGYELDFDQGGVPRTSPRRSKDFTSPEGIRIGSGESLDNLQKYLEIKEVDPTAPGLDAKVAELLQGRCTQYYESGEEFLASAQRRDEKGRPLFDPGGIVIINGSLDLSKGINSQIRGGIIIVNGSLTLGSIARGQKTTDEIFKSAINLKQEEVLTFIINSPAKDSVLTLTGDIYLGVHLAFLSPIRATRLEISRPLLFFGSLALSRPDLKRLSKSLKSSDRESAFYYLPALGKTPPALTLSINPRIIAYRFERDES